MQENTIDQNKIGLSGIVLCAVLILLLGFLPKISAFSVFLRPAVIAVCLVFNIRVHYAYSTTTKIAFAFLFYYILIYLANPLTKSAAWSAVSIVLFIVFFVVVTSHIWNRRELLAILISTIVAGDIMAIVILNGNSELLKGEGVSYLSFLGSAIITNTAAFCIVPGTVSSLLLFLFGKKKSKVIKVALLASYGFCFFVLFCISCRCAFYSTVMASCLLVYEKIKNYKNVSKRLAAGVLIIVVIAGLFSFAIIKSEGRNTDRLFGKEAITNDNGRGDLAEKAIELYKQKPVFGGGLDYWELESGEKTGTHNAFLTTIVESGTIGGIILALFLLSAFIEMVRSRSMIPLALAAEAFLHSYTEPSLDYYVYIPLALSFVVMRYARYNKIPVREIFQ